VSVREKVVTKWMFKYHFSSEYGFIGKQMLVHMVVWKVKKNPLGLYSPFVVGSLT